MGFYVLKILVTVAVVVVASEIAKRESFWAALLMSLPVTSLMAFVWLYVETGDVDRVAALSRGIFWMLLPSLLLFVLLPVLLRLQAGFWTSLGLASAATVLAYAVTLRLLGVAGIEV